MVVNEDLSLRGQVFQYFRDHPPEVFQRSCSPIFKAFSAKTPELRQLIRKYKAQYRDIVTDFWNKKGNNSKYSRDKQDKRGDGKKEEEDAKPKLPEMDPGFFNFCRWFSVPEYKGAFEWQKEHHALTWDATYEMTCVPRDHGKSIIYLDKYEWGMQYREVDLLLLGWTTRRKEIARYVYNFFAFYDLIEQDRQTSPFHFRIKNGGRFDCFLITSKETLGMHSEGELSRFADMTEEDWLEYKGFFEVDIDEDSQRSFDENELKKYIDSRKGSNRKLWISIDDPIDISFMKERHKEESLELHFNSSLYGIHPWKWSFTGTRKFEGDFFDFIAAKFGGELVQYIRKTRNLDGSLLCPERFTAPDQPNYERDLQEGKRDLNQVREHVGEYAWFSEYEQEPHPVAGEVWDHVVFEDLLKHPLHKNYDMCFITVDRATTTNAKSDYTGCLIGLREIQTGIRVITHDYTDKIPIDELLIKINDYIDHFHKQYENLLILLIVEKQGGGDDFCRLARSMREFIKEDGTRVRNVIPEVAPILEIHNTGEKLQRIKDRVNAPFKNERIRFLIQLKHSEIIKEILDYPHSSKIDALDALANSEFELLAYPVGQSGSMVDDLIRVYTDQDKKDTAEEEQKKVSKLDEILSRSYKRRSVF